MKQLILLFSIVLCSLAATAQSVFEYQLKTLSGDSLSIGQFAGKKTMFIVLPLTQQDAVYQQLQLFKSRYGDSIQIVGIVSKEDGYQTSQQSAILNLYAAMGIVSTEAVFTRKESGTNQAPLLQWLTQKEKNRHFNNDATGIGTKFFVSEGGRLYAVLPPQASLQMPLIDRIVHSNTSAENNQQ